MKDNFQITAKEDGKQYWISRSVAVAGFIYRLNFPNVEVLTEIRGKGVDHSGERCAICGYLNWDETLTEALKREAYEETGIQLDPSKLQCVYINSDPSENRQNVTVHYLYYANNGEDFDLDVRHGGEQNEVERVEWLPVCNMLDSRGQYLENIPRDFCFNHRERILQYLPTILKQICDDQNEKDEEN